MSRKRFRTPIRSIAAGVVTLVCGHTRNIADFPQPPQPTDRLRCIACAAAAKARHSTPPSRDLAEADSQTWMRLT